MIKVWLSMIALGFSSPVLACHPIDGLETDLSSYYESVDNDANADALAMSLNAVIRDQTRLTYGCLWEVLSQADADSEHPDHVVLIYTRKRIPAVNRASGPRQAEPDYWNREHVWSASHGVRNTSAFTDAHHIFASDRTVNSSRGNKDFDEGGNRHQECTLCFTDANSWEPPDEVKGDIARVMFYMVTRYEGNGDSSGTADLELVDRATRSGEPTFGRLTTLQRWHCEDPVSARERVRNDAVYQWQGNRNPYVDRPDWVERVWGFACEG